MSRRTIYDGDRERMIAYLLGEMPPDERAQMQEAYFQDPEAEAEKIIADRKK